MMTIRCGRKPGSRRTPAGPAAAAVLTAILLVGSMAAPAAAAFRYRAATPPNGAPVRPAADPPTPDRSCSYSSADLLAAPTPGAGSGGRDGRYWLRCGETLVAALIRWGQPDDVLIVAPKGGSLWRASMDYRFLADGFDAALALLKHNLAASTGQPILHYDKANQVVTVLEGPTR